MRERGHTVRFIGPRPREDQRDGPPDTILLSALSFRQYANIRFAMPWPPTTWRQHPDVDVVHAHANSMIMHWAAMVRELHNVPCVQTNTVYLPAFVHHAIPEALTAPDAMAGFWQWATDAVEGTFAGVYGAGDGLIVQCQGLVDYWRKVGLQVPIHVIPRPIDVRNFDRVPQADPFRPDFPAGGRLLVACRHAGEKSLDRLLTMFARELLPRRASASLTLVGDGPARASLERLAARLGAAERCHFVGEVPQRELPGWYRHADVFAYTSMCETFGQVVSEALWCGLPVVAVADGMGVSHQVTDGDNGLLVAHDAQQDTNLAAAIGRALDDDGLRARLGARAAERQRTLTHPEIVYAAYENAYAEAAAHLRANPPTVRPGKGLRDKLGLVDRHIFPWAWKHTVLVGTGIMPSGYKPRKDVAFDAPPEDPADV